MSPLLIDTCVVVFTSMNVTMRTEATDAIVSAAAKRQLFISPISAWEIGMLMAKRRLKSTLPPVEFFKRFVGLANAAICDLDAEALINSSFLPGEPHGDPMDRALIATARERDWTLVTRDRAILSYGKAGYVKALAC